MTPPSWQPDPMGRHELRWWDGRAWTEHVTSGGVRSIDPIAPQGWSAPVTPSTPVHRTRTPLLIGVAAALLVIGLTAGAIIIFSGTDTGDVTSIATTSVAGSGNTEASEVPATTNDSSVEVSPELLITLLPSIDDVPADWSMSFEGDPAPEPASGEGYGYCGGDNAIARARSSGSILEAYGPGWELPDGSTFGTDVLVFESDADAQAFLDGTLEQANACGSDPVTFTAPESDADWLADGFGDDAEWTVVSASSAETGGSPDSDGRVIGYVDDTYVTTVDTSSFSVTYSAINVYERFGSMIVLFWSDGSWGFTGFTSEPAWAHRPLLSELEVNINEYRDLIVSRMSEIGVV